MTKKVDTRQALTFDEWFAHGYRIKKGEKSTRRNAKGQAVFTMDQVWFVPPNSRSQYLKPIPKGPPPEVIKSIRKKEQQLEDRHMYIDPDFDPDEPCCLPEFEPPF